MNPIVTSNPNVMHGTPCFAGTRVAVQSFFDHLEAGYTVDEFLSQFPTVKREQVIELLAQLKHQAEQWAVGVWSYCQKLLMVERQAAAVWGFTPSMN
jgi:uncharacterized protein (DUF433 family)